MAKMKGLCRNEECELCDQIQEVEKSNFVCEKCGKPLIPFGGNNTGGNWMKKHGKQLVIGTVAIVVVCGGIILGLTQWPDGDGKKKPGTTLNVNSVDTVKKESVIVKDSVNVKDSVEVCEKQPKIQPQKEVRTGEKHKPIKAVQSKNGKGTVNLGYGIYTGDLKNGQPHGYGTITYRTRHQIVSSKDFWANPGDRFQGDFRDGRISGIGYWYHDGEQTAIKP